MVDVGDLGDVGVMVGVNEVDVIGSPAHHEYCHNYGKHLYQLKLDFLCLQF